MTQQAGFGDAVYEHLVLGRAAVPPAHTLHYGEHPDQVLDLWWPAAGAGRNGTPGGVSDLLVVLLHGGFWRPAYSRHYLSPLAAALAAQGHAVINAGYRRTAWAETFDDLARIVDRAPREYVRARLATLPAAVRPRLRRPRTVLVGHSAGGHLALWAAARHRLPADCHWRRAAPPALQRVIGLGAVADLGAAAELGLSGGAATDFLGGPELAASRLRLSDPALLLPTGVPTVLVHGREDREVPPALVEGYAAAARAAGETELTVRLLDGAGHYAPVDPEASPLFSLLVDGT